MALVSQRGGERRAKRLLSFMPAAVRLWSLDTAGQGELASLLFSDAIAPAPLSVFVNCLLGDAL